MVLGICGKQKVSQSKVKDARLLRKKMTRAESILWEHLRDRRCGGHKFRRQQIIKGFVADFYCEQAQIAVELDGGVHGSELAKSNDAQRDDVFKSRGVKTIRFKNAEVESDVEPVLKIIEELCSRNLKPSRLTEWETKRTHSPNVFITPLFQERGGQRPG